MTLNLDVVLVKMVLNKINLKEIKSTPKGTFKIGLVYYRADRIKKPNTLIKLKNIKPDMAWCNDPKSKFYNKEIKINKSISHERLYRKDYKYDIFLVIKYNYKKTKKVWGSAIFLHLTKNYQAN